MMTAKHSVSPKGHFGTKRLSSILKEEHVPCTLEMIQKFHSTVYYTTRTADNKVHHLSVLICAEPRVDQEELSMGADVEHNADISDAIVSDEDDFGSVGGVQATIEPFVLVLVTQ